ncbi:MAG TPA: cytochrome c family protein [Allosphingosinicella sp.]|nr:cytochrome c family protein [Allosphingosinicella sp.]
MADAPPPSRNGRLAVVGLLLVIAAAVALALLLLRPDPQDPVKVDITGQTAPEQPLTHYLARADAARGQAYFARCSACHTVEQGGPNAVGPNLWGVMGNRIASRPDATYSPALQRHGGTWDWAAMDAFLKSPREFAPGTRMTYSGVLDPQDRADVLLYLNSLGGTLPPPAQAAR